MKIFTIRFGLKEENINYTECLNRCKAVANQRALDAIARYVANSTLGDETISITTDEWIRGIPYEKAPNVIPFTKTLILETE